MNVQTERENKAVTKLQKVGISLWNQASLKVINSKVHTLQYI